MASVKVLESSNEKLGILNIIVLILSVYVLGALIVDSVMDLSPVVSDLLIYIDDTICAFFFFEFCVRLINAQDKRRFMRWGWIDLISSVPMIGFLRAGRLFRMIRLLRILRAFRSIKGLLHHVFANKAQGAFATVLSIAVLLLLFCSFAILQVETDPKSNIKTAEDAIWWSYVTITTVGYGDKYPVTTEGRLIATVLMTAGVGLFGTFTAYASSWFLSTEKKDTVDKKE